MASSPRFFSIQPDAFWRRFLRRWKMHRHGDNAAALTFFCLVSLVPVLLIGVTVAGGMLGEKAAHGELEKQLTAMVGSDAARFLEGVLQSSRLNSANPVALGFAVIGLFYAGSHVLAKLRKTLNVINGVEPTDPARPVLSRLLSRAVCAGLLLIFGVLLVAGTLVEGFVAYFANSIDAPFINKLMVLKGYQVLSTYLLLTITFFMILKILPRRRPPMLPALYGALLSAAAVGSLKSALDMYLQRSMLASIFGTGLTVLVFLYWMFLSIQAFLAGAEVTAMITAKRGGMLLGRKDSPGSRPGI